MGRECFEALSEHDCQQIYDAHQRELIENAKHNFQVSIFLKNPLPVFSLFFLNCFMLRIPTTG